MIIKLQPYEWAMAASVGMRRNMSAIADGRPDQHGFIGEGWGVHIEGACGEMAVAKALGVYWDGSVNTFKGPDVGSIQVRTRSEDYYGLLVRAKDADDDVFVLVTGRSPEFVIRGWLRGSEAKREEWLSSHGGRPPAYFVPQERLRPIGELHGLHHVTESMATGPA